MVTPAGLTYWMARKWSTREKAQASLDSIWIHHFVSLWKLSEKRHLQVSKSSRSTNPTEDQRASSPVYVRSASQYMDSFLGKLNLAFPFLGPYLGSYQLSSNSHTTSEWLENNLPQIINRYRAFLCHLLPRKAPSRQTSFNHSPIVHPAQLAVVALQLFHHPASVTVTFPGDLQVLHNYLSRWPQLTAKSSLNLPCLCLKINVSDKYTQHYAYQTYCSGEEGKSLTSLFCFWVFGLLLGFGVVVFVLFFKDGSSYVLKNKQTNKKQKSL